jgi:peptide/nickel transport system permease protein
LRFLVRRVGLAIPVLLGVSTITFFAMTLAAGDYIPGLDLQSNLQPGDLERLKENLGLDRPLHVQYLTWLWALLHGDFGRSMIDSTSITAQIAERLPNTLELAITAVLLALLVSIPIGVIGATRHGTWPDQVLSVVSVAGYAVPQFWLGLIVILVFSVWFHQWGLPWLPTGGAYDPLAGDDPFYIVWDRFIHLVLPATVLAFTYISIWSRYTRSSMLSVLSQDYVRTARAKGMSERRVVYVHAVRNALLPLVTLVGLTVPQLLSGSLVVEVIFGWPGVGRFAFDRAREYDFPAVLGVTVFVAIMVVLGNLIADLVYGIVDPRIRLE